MQIMPDFGNESSENDSDEDFEVMFPEHQLVQRTIDRSHDKVCGNTRCTDDRCKSSLYVPVYVFIPVRYCPFYKLNSNSKPAPSH